MRRRTSPLAILNPEHLFQQAEQLILPPAAGPPRQVNIRRAISAAYFPDIVDIVAIRAPLSEDGKPTTRRCLFPSPPAAHPRTHPAAAARSAASRSGRACST